MSGVLYRLIYLERSSVTDLQRGKLAPGGPVPAKQEECDIACDSLELYNKRYSAHLGYSAGTAATGITVYSTPRIFITTVPAVFGGTGVYE